MPSPSPRRTAGIFAAVVALAAPCVDADDLGAPMFSLGGFGTLGAAHSSEHLADFTTNVFNANGAGFTRDWSASVDSLIAAQVAATFTPRLSAVLQVISQQNYDNTYWPHVEWADVKYQFTPDFSLRVGRIVLPSFLVSDARAVGYSNPWVRPPIEVYGLIPISNSDGADASYRVRTGNAMHRVTATYGSTNRKIPVQGSIDARRNWLISDTMEWGPATLHIAYQHTRLSVDYLNGLFDAFRSFGQQGNALADRYGTKNKVASFFGLGGMYDPGNWFVTAEWGTTELNSVLGRSIGWYVSGGYRLATFTPYLTYAQARADNLSDPGLPVSVLPSSLTGPVTALNAALDAVLSTKRVQSTSSAGARWDFMKNTDFKLQFDHTRIGAGSTGELINTQPGYRLGGVINLFSATVDFVF